MHRYSVLYILLRTQSFCCFSFLIFVSVDVLLSVWVSFVFGHGSIFIILVFQMGNDDFDVLVAAVHAVIQLFPDLFDCGKVLLVSDIGFGLLRERSFPS
jgi:hypothetical protein